MLCTCAWDVRREALLGLAWLHLPEKPHCCCRHESNHHQIPDSPRLGHPQHPPARLSTLQQPGPPAQPSLPATRLARLPHLSSGLQVMGNLAQYNPEQLSELLWSFAILGHLHPHLVDTVTQSVLFK